MKYLVRLAVLELPDRAGGRERDLGGAEPRPVWSEDCSDFLVSLDVEYDLDFKVIRLFMYLRGSGSVKCQFCSFTLRERVLK